MQLGRVDPPGDVGQLGGGQVAEAAGRAAPAPTRAGASSPAWSAWVSADPPTIRHSSPVLSRCGSSRPSRPRPMIAARSRRGVPPGCVRRHLEDGLSRVEWPMASRRSGRESVNPAGGPLATRLLSASRPRSKQRAGRESAGAGRPPGNALTTRPGIPWPRSAPPGRPALTVIAAPRSAPR